MDGFTEKKWFVYIGDKHEGPFSLEEIQGEMVKSRVTRESFVWADGMADWKPMPEVPDFSVLLNPAAVSSAPPPTPPPSSSPAPATSEAEGIPVLMPALGTPSFVETPSTSPPATQEKTGDLDPEDLKAAQEFTAGAQAEAKAGSNAEKEEEVKEDITSPDLLLKKRKGLLLPVVLTSFILMTATLGIYKAGYLGKIFNAIGLGGVAIQLKDYGLSLSEKLPFLEKWISPIPQIEDLAPEDYEIIQRMARQKIQPGQAIHFEMALTRTDALAPVIYISSNLSEPISVRVYVVGISDTLLNQVSFLNEFEVRIIKKLGRTPVIRTLDGHPVPRGEYAIYIVPVENQPASIRALLAVTPSLGVKIPTDVPAGVLRDQKILGFKSYFLGGGRDSIYAARLQEFHEKLRTKAENELGEVHQFITTIESQLSSSKTKFDSVRKLRASRLGRKQWDAFHVEWMKLQEQLDLIFRKWTPEVLSKEYFYGSLYQLVQQAGLGAQKVHEFHHSYFVGVADAKTFDIQLGEAVSSATNALNLLKSRVDQVEKLAPTPNGMPRRDEP